MEKILKNINILMVIFNVFYIIIINTVYIAIPLPNKIYLKNLSLGYPYYITYGDILYILISVNLCFYLIYLVVRQICKKSIK